MKYSISNTSQSNSYFLFQTHEEETEKFYPQCTSTYSYAFNGKLHDDDIYGKVNSYDYGARFYDPRLGMFLSVDPFAQKHPNLSPFIYSADGPIVMSDHDGRDFSMQVTNNKDGTNTIVITATYYTVSQESHEQLVNAAKLWTDLSGTTVKIGDKTYTVTVNIQVDPGIDVNKLTFGQGRKNFDATKFTENRYGDANFYSGSKDYSSGEPILHDTKIPGKYSDNNIGETDGNTGNLIDMPTWTSGKNSFVSYATDPKSVAHEIGHTLGLGDFNSGKIEPYSSKGGAMDYKGPFNPTPQDLVDVINYGLNGGGAVNAHVNLSGSGGFINDLDKTHEEKKQVNAILGDNKK